jgi:hypothetical protein
MLPRSLRHLFAAEDSHRLVTLRDRAMRYQARSF